MAKYKRKKIGSIIKNKDPKKPDYLQVDGDHVLKNKQYLNLESKKFQLDSLQAAQDAGKLTEEVADKIRSRVENIPDFVRFEVIALTEE